MNYHPDLEAADLRIELDMMTRDRDSLHLELQGLEQTRLRDNAYLIEDRNRWIQLFNRLERHVTRHFENSPACNVHEAGGEFDLDEDLELYRGWVSVMNAASQPLNETGPAEAGPASSKSSAADKPIG